MANSLLFLSPSLFWSLLPLPAPSGSGQSSGSQESTATKGNGGVRAQLQLYEPTLLLDVGVAGRGASGNGGKLAPVSGTLRGISWKHRIWPGCGHPSALLPGSSLWKLGHTGGRAAGRNEAERQSSAVSCPDTLAQVLGTLLTNTVKVSYSYQ